jgi:hypothetical protein
MGIGVFHTTTQRDTLVVAALLALSGLASLQFVGNQTTAPIASEYARGIPGESSTTTDFLPTTSQLARKWLRTTTTTLFQDGAAGGNAPPAEPTPQPTAPPSPETQLDVAIPALGAGASAGAGEGSCTTVRLTPITPEGCPEPSGEGPVIVRYSGTGEGRNIRA